MKKSQEKNNLSDDSISFVIASFNDSDVIGKTINSIKINLRKKDRIIVIDGASTDDTLNVLQGLQKNTPQLEFLSEPDSGIYDAWNKALKNISSPWVSFIGCGDLLRPDYREHVSIAVKEHPDSKFIHGIAQMYLWDSKKSSIIKLRVFGKKIQFDEFKRRMRVCHVGALHHHSLFHDMVFSTDYKCVSDYHFLLKKLSVLRPTFINRVLVDMEASGISQNSIFPMKEELLMKKDIGGYSTSRLYIRMVWTCIKFYLFKVYNFKYRLKQ